MALCSLEIEDARARYGVLKVRTRCGPGRGRRRVARSGRRPEGTLTRHAATQRAAASDGRLPLQNGTEGTGPQGVDTVGGNSNLRRPWRPGVRVASGQLGAPWRTPAPKHRLQEKLLRKEVIQPHLPVRLPCYDFTPIADPTFDGSLLAVGPPASGVTNFRGVTGGVYKARERIHPGVADPGLLATPTSWSRVADSNPN